MIDIKQRLLGCILLVLALATACSGRGTGGPAPSPLDDVEEEEEEEEEEEPATTIVRSDPAVLATFEPWEASCIRWLRGNCRKSNDCDLPLANECDDDDQTLRITCNEMADDDENPCVEPDARSFDACLSRTIAETCTEFCDTQFCFDFCFFGCLD